MIEEDKDNEYAKEILRKEMNKRSIEKCPHCNSKHYIRHGMYRGIQRFRCKECGKTFSLVTTSLCKYSKKTIEKWSKFIDLMLERKTLRECARKLNINLVTAFYWRHKVLNGLENISVPKKLKGDVYISKGVVKENFKGSRNIQTTIRKNILLFEAKGSEKSILAVPVCKDTWNIRLFNSKIYYRIDKESYIISYGDRYLSAIAKKHNINLLRKTKGEEDKVKYFRFYLKVWLVKFRGVATKYLREYLSWFVLHSLEILKNKRFIINQLQRAESYIRGTDIRFVQKDQ